ncbi:CBO0543 family protein [Halalkalibacter alkalisediminis]|uniref:CBO0543 family protein n=1 Tax=Halalkalibacter alkalisediminis TaxID=935616 RepID=A0ABV6NFL6_9BACI|nr:CBO0543 family protein [Halalkalibacter alkalisediminis]
MSKEQIEKLTSLRTSQKEITNEWINYWLEYSFLDTWQFWIVASMLILPLVILYFKMDRSKAFLLGFYGFNIHVWFSYTDTIFVRIGLVSYPYQAIPVIPANFGLDVSLVPVLFMFLYQYVLNHKKNYYIYATGLSAALAFVLKPYLVVFNLFELHNVNYFHLFLAYVVVFLVSKWITDLFLYFTKTSKIA